MKRVLKIFVHDLVGLSRNIFALIIAVGLCIIPSLYAWFNIYSNWDPYANTSSIKVAVVSQDAGYKNSDRKNVNMGDEVLDTLRKNKGLGWQITWNLLMRQLMELRAVNIMQLLFLVKIQQEYV